jgi:hypothetical protein
MTMAATAPSNLCAAGRVGDSSAGNDSLMVCSSDAREAGDGVP